MGALKYNLNKLVHPDPSKRAELLATNFSSMNTRVIKQEVDLVRGFRPALNRYVYHTSLNFSVDDKLDNTKLLAIALDYLEKSGYQNNQYLIFRHHDAEHPHLHLLVNRIDYDGQVVSDSNNFKKSEQILRELELKYNLVTVEQSNHVSKNRRNTISVNHPISNSVELNNLVAAALSNKLSRQNNIDVSSNQRNLITYDRYNKVPRRAPTRNEIARFERTGRPSEKILLQEKLLHIISARRMSLQDFIATCETHNIHLLFNQASTGRISGITYFYNGLKVRGQALGNRFKWMELIKNIDYEQDRDGKAVSAANDRTRARYDQRSTETRPNRTGTGVVSKNLEGTPLRVGNPATGNEGSVSEDDRFRDNDTIDIERLLAAGESADFLANRSVGVDYSYTGEIDIQISDDIDDEAILGRNRHRQKKARTNTR